MQLICDRSICFSVVHRQPVFRLHAVEVAGTREVAGDVGVPHLFAEVASSHGAGIASDPIHPNARWFHGGLGAIALRRGDVIKALSHYARAIKIYDSDGRMYTEYAIALNSAGKYREAINVAQTGRELIGGGSHSVVLRAEEIFALVALDEVDEARTKARNALNTTASRWHVYLAPAVAAAGLTEELDDLLDQSEDLDRLAPGVMSLLYAHLGNIGRAFELLPKAIDLRSGLSRVHSHSALGPLRGDQRWEEVMLYLEQEEARGRAHNQSLGVE